MSGTPQPIRGMNDVLPDDSAAWQRLERAARETFAEYGYREIRLPLLERTELFKRSIGEMTDIVEKEMYTFDDRGGESVTLRPEATAGIVRACLSNGLLHNQRQRVWCMGPMFRYERPQKGRYRQFHQIDVEALGFPGPDVDAELILMSARIWKRLGLRGLALKLNSLGTAESRRVYRERLVEYFGRHLDLLDEDSRRRLGGNPLRILDSKNPHMQELIESAPKLMDFLGEASLEHFGGVQALLKEAGIPYRINPRLVRGLDYYNLTVFEWITDKLGAQGTVCAGGRYDGLIAQLGGKPAPACGFAMGVERLVAMLKEEHGGGAEQAARTEPAVYIVHQGAEALAPAFRAAETLRAVGLDVVWNCGGGSFKSQMKRADASGAQVAVILGEDEAREGSASLKPLREEAPQRRIPQDQLAEAIGNYLFGDDNDGSL